MTHADPSHPGRGHGTRTCGAEAARRHGSRDLGDRFDWSAVGGRHLHGMLSRSPRLRVEDLVRSSACSDGSPRFSSRSSPRRSPGRQRPPARPRPATCRTGCPGRRGGSPRAAPSPTGPCTRTAAVVMTAAPTMATCGRWISETVAGRGRRGVWPRSRARPTPHPPFAAARRRGICSTIASSCSAGGTAPPTTAGCARSTQRRASGRCCAT
jgi:hypothetical protein